MLTVENVDRLGHLAVNLNLLHYFYRDLSRSDAYELKITFPIELNELEELIQWTRELVG